MCGLGEPWCTVYVCPWDALPRVALEKSIPFCLTVEPDEGQLGPVFSLYIIVYTVAIVCAIVQYVTKNSTLKEFIEQIMPFSEGHFSYLEVHGLPGITRKCFFIVPNFFAKLQNG